MSPDRDGLVQAVGELPPEYRAGAEFLIANMPDVDLAQMTSRTLEQDVLLAYKTRTLFPWTRQIPDDVFMHYVLPYRVTQEPISDWRPMFYDSLYPLVRTCSTMTQAIVTINKWYSDRVAYRPNAPRDQGPLQTLASGWGRCEEMMIVQIDALRAMGIPARETYVPYWSTCESNHAWTEVWADGKWHDLRGAVPQPLADDAWNKEAIKNAPLVMNVSFGIPPNEASYYRREKGYAILNNTAHYTRTGIISVKVTSAGRPLKGISVCVSVFNSGALRPIARVVTDKDGAVCIPLGIGDYVVSAGSPEQHCVGVVTCTGHAVQQVALDLTQPSALPERFWLWYQP